MRRVSASSTKLEPRILFTFNSNLLFYFAFEKVCKMSADFFVLFICFYFIVKILMYFARQSLLNSSPFRHVGVCTVSAQVIRTTSSDSSARHIPEMYKQDEYVNIAIAQKFYRTEPNENKPPMLMPFVFLSASLSILRFLVIGIRTEQLRTTEATQRIFINVCQIS